MQTAVKILAILLLGTWGAGCVGLARESCVEHLPGGKTLCGRAPADGVYLLWQIRSEGFEHQLQEVMIHKGDPIGFDCSEPSPVAVAGSDRFALPAGWYRWDRRVPGGEQATIVAVRVALFPVMLAAFSGGAP